MALCAALVAITWVVTSDGDSERSTSTSRRPPPGTARSDVPSEPPAGSVPVTVVKIDNVETARPQTGLDVADVVYVEPVEGGYTRLAVVYSSELPDVAGPCAVRGRPMSNCWPSTGTPRLVFSGAAPEIEPVLAESAVRLVRHSDYPDAFFREPGRPSPHNLYARLPLLPRVDGPGPEQVLPRGDTPPVGGRSPTHGGLPARRYGFTWSPESRRWQVRWTALQ